MSQAIPEIPVVDAFSRIRGDHECGEGEVVVVKDPRSRPQQGLPLDREQRPPTCHPLGPSLCSLPHKLQLQP